MQTYKEVHNCRICGNDRLLPILNLGKQVLSGIFPDAMDRYIPSTPLELVKCSDDGLGSACGLLQLKHSADVNEMYGTTYGYYSSLSVTMVNHLQHIHQILAGIRMLGKGDAVLDIGCNDGTLLKLITTPNVKRVGIDPSSKKFEEKFDDDIELVCDYFSKASIDKHVGDGKYHQITAIAMFYDLDEPLRFLQDIRSVLAEDGIWAIELAYMPTMLTNLVYDQICHEHVTYPALKQIQFLVAQAGLKIVDVEFNNVNGGSFLVVGCRDDADYQCQQQKLQDIVRQEDEFCTAESFEKFSQRIESHRKDVRQFFDKVLSNGQSVLGYGASTKGNIVLNYCDVGPNQMKAIGDANPEKWTRVTPGSNIPIVSKEEVRNLKPDYLFVLIWHFHREVLEEERDYVMQGGKIVFDLPKLHIVDKSNYDHHLDKGFSDYQYDF